MTARASASEAKTLPTVQRTWKPRWFQGKRQSDKVITLIPCGNGHELTPHNARDVRTLVDKCTYSPAGPVCTAWTRRVLGHSLAP
jgi:hypothetical protein